MFYAGLRSFRLSKLNFLPFSAKAELNWSEFVFKPDEKLGVSLAYSSRYEAPTGNLTFTRSGKNTVAVADMPPDYSSDYLELLEFVDAIRADREPYIDVYDSASWSSLVELSARSIDAGGSSVEIPDFTNGKWEKWSA